MFLPYLKKGLIVLGIIVVAFIAYKFYIYNAKNIIYAVTHSTETSVCRLENQRDVLLEIVPEK